jgi:hypothetical protein
VTYVGFDWSELSRSEEAQQLSACACVVAWGDDSLPDSPLCIGQVPPCAQQAMRASGVAAQPAQIAAFPAIKPRHNRTAVRRCPNPTDLRMLDLELGVKQLLFSKQEWGWLRVGHLVHADASSRACARRSNHPCTCR